MNLPPTQWRSLDELERTAPLDQQTEGNPADEFPAGAAEMADGVLRRSFLQLLGSSALAGLAACTRPPSDKVFPYAKQPIGLTPGRPLHYATSFVLGGYGTGLLVTSWEGRPTKIEGNPRHPISQGASSTWEQACLLGLYDPHRAKTFTFQGEPTTWKRFLSDWTKSSGEGLYFLLEPNASPLLASLREKIRQAHPQAKMIMFDPAHDANAAQGAAIAFGQPHELMLEVSKASVIASFGSDFLNEGPGYLKQVREHAARRVPGSQMNRLYVIEDRLSVTGMNADHRLPVRPTRILELLRAVTHELARDARFSSLARLGASGQLSEAEQRWSQALARDLAREAGKSAVLVGMDQPPAAHALAHAVNGALGNLGQTVRLLPPAMPDVEQGLPALESLARDMEAGKVKTLVMTAFNPVYSAPANLGFRELLKKVPKSVYFGPYVDETASVATWFIPASHALESWGDARAIDGTLSVVQPLVTPLFDSVSEVEMLAAFTKTEADKRPYQILKDFWHKQSQNALDFESRWESWLSEGLLPDSPSTSVKPLTEMPAVRTEGIAAALGTWVPPSAAEDEFELHFVPDYRVRDGRFADNAWLQELPDPVTKLTWDNAAFISVGTARKLKIRSGDWVQLTLDGQTLDIPVMVIPGQADGSITLPLGYGRTGTERVAKNVGVNVGPLRTSEGFSIAPKAKLQPLGRTHALAVTQEHWSMAPRVKEEPASKYSGNEPPRGERVRHIALQTTVAKLEEQEEELHHLRGEVPALYAPTLESPSGYQWGMAIDLSRCLGCNACMVACQSENNIPVVGKEGVLKSREMHWLRIDRYFEGPPENPQAVMQPMACVHCEKAPCESVCPVNATVHSNEGLNEMVYNRCVGTRYCSNNCPYKVRRFNFFHYTADKSLTERMAMNPDVTVRARGVMEKCTYCVQRIERKRIDTRIEGRTIKDGELKSACQQVCAAEAIVFGNLADKSSKVSALHADARRYDVLHELGTKPRTAYLVRVKNPNPELV